MTVEALLPDQAVNRQIEADVVLASQGDAEAFRRIVERCSRTVTSIALAIARDVQASEDIAQEVFLAAWRGLKQLRNPASFLPWLRQMTRNQANNWLRRELRPDAIRKGDVLLEALIDPRPDSGEVLLRSEQERLIAEAISSLPDEAREVITLFYREGRSVRQVSTLLGLTEAAVKQRLSRARNQIRDEVLDSFGTALERTAPGAAFAGAVLSAMAFTAPTATAATFGAAKLLSFGAATKALAVISGPLAGAAGSIIGLTGKVRSHYVKADEREKQRLRRYVVASIPVSLFGAGGILLGAALRSPMILLSCYAIFFILILLMTRVWLPDIIRERLAKAAAADPAEAARQARARRLATIGCWLGSLAGWATMIGAIWLSGMWK